jgi:hypothetical protein
MTGLSVCSWRTGNAKFVCPDRSGHYGRGCRHPYVAGVPT